MTKMFISIMLISFSSIMYFLNHPLSMGIMILTQTLLTCIILGMLIKTYCFSYILFLTFLGGLLVLFIYVSSIASNELFIMTFKMKMFILLITMMNILLSILLMNNLNWMNLSISSEMEKFFNYYFFFNNENKINLNKLYNNQTFFTMMMMIIYLFITLVAVVKITNIFYGPLRSTM
ncbi:NADH dehydrogenase subunit 6 (mitochondrion) [Pectinophora gossypiella]|uniref:NADH-ubiquinone oxidoreductase chain 6 n=1 Tax=Pectinophora gossypiella TaxID=13191 RepID=A0A0K0KW15_PECGO|nr:NADH dehydrogenase subunit 6 [Pectinophora gossypiella]AIR12132.2 NADH dehydrogenase subunit 6 [Pectinophora gossypiella]